MCVCVCACVCVFVAYMSAWCVCVYACMSVCVCAPPPPPLSLSLLLSATNTFIFHFFTTWSKAAGSVQVDTDTLRLCPDRSEDRTGPGLCSPREASRAASADYSALGYHSHFTVVQFHSEVSYRKKWGFFFLSFFPLCQNCPAHPFPFLLPP